MPEQLERELRSRAATRWPGNKKRQDAYVYGTLRKTGWRPGSQTSHNPTYETHEGKVDRTWEEPF